MARYTGPRLKIVRALGVELPGLTRKSAGERNYPPGQHGQRMRKKSDYGLKLIEKQKLRFNYGVSESQIRRLFREAKAGKEPTGNKLLELLERRLDNLVFRAGFAPTIPAARQLVSHGHFQLNGKRVTIPSIRLRVGDSFGPTEAGSKIDLVRFTREAPSLERPEWISLDDTTLTARLTHLPDADAAPFPLDLQRIVEYYATRM